MIKLKPCPFCGGMRPHACICGQKWAVRCDECGALVMSDSADDGGKSAAKRWNARASEEDRRTVRTCNLELIDSFHEEGYLGERLDEFECDACGKTFWTADGGKCAFCPSCGRKVENMIDEPACPIEPDCDTCRDSDATCRGKVER